MVDSVLGHPVAASVVVAGTASGALANQLARDLQVPLANTDIKRFPDGEGYARILDDLTDHTALVVQSTWPDPNLIEMLLLQDAAREAGAKQVHAIVPYYGYARQDRAFHSGEAISSRAAARALGANCDHLTTIDPHKPSILEFLPCPGTAVSAVPQIAAELGRWGVDAILAPDKGARDRAGMAASILELPHDHLEKTRLGPTEVRIETKELDVAGARVAILDDMIASGGTMIQAAKQLKEQGATTVYAACTHGVFNGGAVDKLLAGGIDRVLCTDTLEQGNCSTISAAPAVAQSLQTVTA